MSADIAYELRVLLFKLSQQLSKEESNALVAIEELPARLRDEKSTPFDVLMHLNMQGRFSSSEDSKFEESAKIFKNINRFDLASQVKEFAKKIKKSKKGKPESMQLHSPTQKLEIQMRVTQIQHNIFTDQIEELLQAANEAGQIRVKGLVDESKSYIEKTSKKLRYIAGLLAAEKEKRLTRSSSSEEESSPVNSRQPRDSTTYVNHPTQVSQCEESTDSIEDEYIEINTNTGDSGFADSKEFLKTEPQKLVSAKKPPAQTTLAATGYTGLNKKTMDRAAYYKTTRTCSNEDVQDVVYETTASARDPDPVYANLPCRQKK